MLKFVVILYRRSDMSPDQFNDYFQNVHGPLADKIPGLKKYIQNYVIADPKRKHPGWDGIAELYFANWKEMESGWASHQGEVATNDLNEFVDLEKTSWSVVEENSIRL